MQIPSEQPVADTVPLASKLRLLLAEGSPSVHQKVREQLERLPFVELVAQAATSQQALELFFDTRPDVVIASVYLPEQNGFEVLRRIQCATSRSLVILTCRWEDTFVDEAASLLGAAGICRLPDPQNKLRALLQRLTGRP